MRTKKNNVVKIIVGFVSVILILGSVGGGLYFGGIFSSSDPLKKSAGNSSGGSTGGLSDGSSGGSTGGSSDGSSGGSTGGSSGGSTGGSSDGSSGGSTGGSSGGSSDGSSGGSSGSSTDGSSSGSTDGSSSGSTDGSSGNNNENSSDEIQEDIKELSQEPDYLASYSSMTSPDANKYEYSCEFTKIDKEIFDATITSSQKEAGDIACIYINKDNVTKDKLNLFPMITFHEERQLLGKLDDGNSGGFVALSNAQMDSNGEQVTLEQQARANAKLIANKIMNQLSYGSEFALLDEIFFSAQIGDSESRRAAGFYSRSVQMVFGENNGQENNDKTIRIKMEEPKTLEADGTIDAIRYLDNIFYTFAHEYGHHLTLYNDRFKESNSFLNELKNVFSDNAGDFSDFEKIYKYFNNLNDDWRKNYDATKSRIPNLSEDDQKIIIDTRNEILSIYRNKYSGNVISLLNEFPERIAGDSNNEKTIIDKLEFWKGHSDIKTYTSTFATNFKTKINDSLAKDENGITTIIDSKYEEFRQYLTDSPIYVYYIDYDQVLEMQNVSFGKVYFFLPASYNQVANSPTFNTNGQNGATIGDIFGNDLDIETIVINTDDIQFVKKINTKDNACSSLPLTFAIVGHTNYDANYFKTAIKDPQYQNMTYNEISEIHDGQMMKRLSYYYSQHELLARLYATLTYRYEKKVPLTACAFKGEIFKKPNDPDHLHFMWGTSSIGYERQFYSDYSLFKAWGMDILHGENAKTMLKALVHINNIPNTDNSNDFTIIQNKRPLISTENTVQMKNFFLSYNVFDEKNSPYTNPWSSMYLLGYINRDISRNNILLEYEYGGHSFYKKALNYNYNNFQYYDPTEPNKLVTWTSNDFTKSKLFPQQDNLMLLVFPLYSLTGTVSPNEPNTVIPNYQDAQTKLGTPTRVFIDTNENMVFDEGDVILAVSS